VQSDSHSGRERGVNQPESVVCSEVTGPGRLPARAWLPIRRAPGRCGRRNSGEFRYAAVPAAWRGNGTRL